VENFNRWISRGRPGSNVGLVTSAPVDFRHEHLPELPGRYSPRLVYGRARATGTFHHEPGWHRHTEAFEVVYPVDASRDLNGVGLLYFASYFSIIDGALLKLWRHLGRDGRSFLDRVVLDQKLCYLGNADHDTVLRLTLDAWRGPEPDQEVIDVTMTDRGRPLAVCTLRIQGRGHVP
jgi:probable biosynthetic protein (TIGR04098 family)